ncbi:MAG: hypothetical protein ABSF90_22165 [Syntrophobacteraceae bacterium]|jgi:hypothetical protein
MGILTLANLFIALFVAYIALQQYFTNKRQVKINDEKLRLDLYNRRFNVYSTALDFHFALVEFSASGEQHKDAFTILHKQFLKVAQESQFLFKPDSSIYDMLVEMHKRSFNRTGFIKHGKEVADTPDVFLSWYQQSEEAQKYSDIAGGQQTCQKRR